MSYIDESQAKGLVKRIFRSLYAAANNSAPQNFEYSQRKICKKIKGLCKEKTNAVLIAERFNNTNKWQLIWGEWCLFSAKKKLFASTSDVEEYDQIAFDLTINVRGGVSYKSFYVVLSKHALVRLIMRSQHQLKNAHDLNLYLKRITKPLVFSALELSDQHTKSNGKISQYSTIIDDVFLPLALDVGINSQGLLAKTCTIKTFMPAHYDGAAAELSRRTPIITKSDFFDYEGNFGILRA
ncbi:hypothetical protein FGD67_11715 [Colwellia sp. M166]|uniref:hypothetical protein n=1 Tax=Colwellia sp. M166 TaxID=2583805 RepID=UPI00211F0070|nr:hypothetical protein [Colwellia sp. M166]UUO23831.1 hypothetical protein FGD67_11715 [Colwellia sp. M166]